MLWSLQKLLSTVDTQYLPTSLLSSIYLVTMLKTAAAAVQVLEVGFNLNSCLAVVGVILDVDEMNSASKTAGLARTAFKTPRVPRPVENWSRVATCLLSTKCCIRHCTTNWRFFFLYGRKIARKLLNQTKYYEIKTVVIIITVIIISRSIITGIIIIISIIVIIMAYPPPPPWPIKVQTKETFLS